MQYFNTGSSEDKGMEKGKTEAQFMLMESLNMATFQAMDALKIPL